MMGDRYVGEFAFQLNNGDVKHHTLDRLSSLFDAAVGLSCTFAPAMIARVTDASGRGATLHLTFLTLQGSKATMKKQRALMPGFIPDGAAIRLDNLGPVLAIGEGIETARKGGEHFGVPTWAAVNATMLRKWEPPADVKEVVVLIDNDEKFGGQAAGFALAHRLACKGLKVRPEVAPAPGTDWADPQDHRHAA